MSDLNSVENRSQVLLTKQATFLAVRLALSTLAGASDLVTSGGACRCLIVCLAEGGAIALVLLVASGLWGQGSLVVVEDGSLPQRADLSEASYYDVS